MAGETVRMVNPQGEAYEIPKELQAKAFSDGLRPQQSLISQVVSAVTDNGLASKVIADITGTGPQLGDIAKAAGQEVLIGKDGSTYVMPADEAAEAVRVGALRRPDLALDTERALVAKAEAGIDPSNEGLRGMVKAGVGSMRNEFVKTATFGAIDPEQDALTATERAGWERTKEMNPVSAGVGTATGFGLGVVADPLAVGSTAAKAGSAVERAVVGEAKSLGGKVLGGAIKGATEGTVMSLPQATRQAIANDPEKGAETMIAGLLGGGLLGGGGRLLGEAKKRAAAKAAEHLTGLAEGADARLGRLEVLTNESLTAEERSLLAEQPYTKGEKIIDTLATTAGGTAMKAMGIAHGPAGYMLAHVAEELLDSPSAQKAITKFVGKAAESALEWGPAIDRVATGAARKGQEGGINVLAQMLGAKEDSGKTKRELHSEVRERLSLLQSDLEKRTELVANVSGMFAPGPHQDAAAAKANNVIDYLYAQCPKPAKPPGPFQRDSYQATMAELASFERKAHVAFSPFDIIGLFEKGQLHRDHVDALKAVYPALANEYRERIELKSMDPKAPPLTKSQRRQLALLVGAPLDDRDPEAVRLYQSFYRGAANDNGGGTGEAPGKLAKVPGTEPTDTQRLTG